VDRCPSWSPKQYANTTGSSSASLRLRCQSHSVFLVNDLITNLRWSPLTSLSLSFSSFTSAFFSPRDVFVVQSTQFNYTKILGQSDNINSTNALIQALLLSTAHGIYGVCQCWIEFLPFILTLIHMNRVQLVFHPSQTYLGPLGQLTP
jgi:hypothetical protein